MALQPTLTRRSLCATLAAQPLAAQARETLRVLAWPGYADPDIVRAFEQRTGAQVQVTYVDSDLDLWNKAGASKGRDYDVFAVNTAELQRYIRAGLVQPVDLSAVPNRRPSCRASATRAPSLGWCTTARPMACLTPTRK